MAQDFKVGAIFGAGIAVDFVDLAEADFAAGAGAAYTPPERGRFRVVAARVIQLLADIQGIITTNQTSAGTIRVPSGLTATDDAGEGRFFFVINQGSGIVTVQDHTGGAIGTVNPNGQVFIFHTTNNAWIITRSIGGGGMIPTAATQVTVTTTVDATEYDLFVNGSSTPPAAMGPDDFNTGWASDAYCQACLDVDLSNMLAGDTIWIKLEKAVDGSNFEIIEDVEYTGVQGKPLKPFHIETNTGYEIKCSARRSGGAAVAIEVLWWGLGNTA